jgi:hypothetical protein
VEFLTLHKLYLDGGIQGEDYIKQIDICLKEMGPRAWVIALADITLTSMSSLKDLDGIKLEDRLKFMGISAANMPSDEVIN